MIDEREPFRGAKVMLFLGADLLVLERDHTPGISWPGALDFPGGFREGAESGRVCAIRETHEETGLSLRAADLRFVFRRTEGDSATLFYAAHLAAGCVADVHFGGEGAGWHLMPPSEFWRSDLAIPHFRVILDLYLRRLTLHEA